MATKSSKVQQLTAEQAAVPVSGPLSDGERTEMATASVPAADEPGSDGRKRLGHQPFTPEAFRGPLRHPAARRVKDYLWIAHSASTGGPLTAEAVEKVAGHDPAMPILVSCVGIVENGGGKCGFQFESTRMAWINSETGKLGTDQRFVNEANPEGVSYEGSFLAIPVEPDNRYSRSEGLGPLCHRCMAETRAFFARAGAGWKIRPRSKEQADILVSSINEERDASRREHLERQSAKAKVYGGSRPGGRNPHQATTGLRVRLDQAARVR